MSTADSQPGAQLKVWDPIVRIGHWVIVTGVLTAYFTGDDVPTLHVWAGYTVAAAVLLRVVWGFIGPRQARFSSFVKGPGAVAAYLKGLATARAERSLGHNPAGGAMIVALLLALSVTTGSGMTLLALEEGAGPLAPIIAQSKPAEARAAGDTPSEAYERAEASEDEHEGGESLGEQGESESNELVETIHKTFVYLTLILAFLHVLGVLWSSLAHRENLVAAMFTGRKRT